MQQKNFKSSDEINFLRKKEKKDVNKNSRKHFGDLFIKLYAKLIPPLQNKNRNLLLALDILQEDIRIELLRLITLKIEEKLIEMIESDVGINENVNGKILLLEIIRESSELFFLKYYGTKVNINITLIRRSLYTNAAFTNSRMLLELFIYTLFNKEAKIFKSTFAPLRQSGSEKFVEILLDNLVIEIGECLIRVILNEFSLIPDVRQSWFRTNFLSIRNTERLKNNLAWQDRITLYINRPRNLYNSAYDIWFIAGQGYGIYQRKIYANRINELLDLKNRSLFIVNYIEFQDFLLCRLDETVFLVSKFIRYILAKLIGQTIALIWRGVVDGLKNED